MLGSADPERIFKFATWSVDRDGNAIRIRVVEPAAYDPPRHAAIFNAVLTLLLSPSIDYATEPDRKPTPVQGQGFDLLTFPELFLPADQLIVVLQAMKQVGVSGCVHVGLVPSLEDGVLKNPLFGIDEVGRLIKSLEQIEDLQPADLTEIKQWVSANKQRQERANLGCLFAKDRFGKIRICLHPKMVRSKWEYSADIEATMIEGNLVSAVTLRPANSSFSPVVVQPLLCSDALELDTELPSANPFAGIFASGEENAPLAVDVVSVACCTPQTPDRNGNTRFLRWSDAWLEAFKRTAKGNGDRRRHLHAAFILSNYRTFPGHVVKAGGLSGAFFPVPPTDGSVEGLATFVYGNEYWENAEGQMEKGTTTKWLPQKDAYPTNILGHIVSLSPDAVAKFATVCVMGFTLQKVLRERSPWGAAPPTVSFSLCGAGQSLVFGE